MGKHSKPDKETPQHKKVREAVEQKQADKLEPKAPIEGPQLKDRPGGLIY